MATSIAISDPPTHPPDCVTSRKVEGDGGGGGVRGREGERIRAVEVACQYGGQISRVHQLEYGRRGRGAGGNGIRHREYDDSRYALKDRKSSVFVFNN